MKIAISGLELYEEYRKLEAVAYPKWNQNRFEQNRTPDPSFRWELVESKEQAVWNELAKKLCYSRGL